MESLRVVMFGKLRIQIAEREVTGVEARKVQELLCRLLFAGGRPLPRELICDLIWGDSPAEQARRSLRQALWRLRAALAAAGVDTDQIIRVKPDWIQIQPSEHLWVDALDFEQRCARLQGVPAAALTAEDARQLREAVALYQGDLLAGWYQDWCLFERERLLGLYLDTLDKLMTYAEAHGAADYFAAVEYGGQILRFDATRERTHRQLMRLHYLVGDRAMAIRQYEQCVAALRRELGVGPSRRTVALYEQIHQDQLADLPPSEPQGGAPPTMVPETIDRLRSFLASLSEMQRRAEDKLSALERALGQ
jgi:DNA-binding SARP family transcriptional activator